MNNENNQSLNLKNRQNPEKKSQEIMSQGKKQEENSFRPNSHAQHEEELLSLLLEDSNKTRPAKTITKNRATEERAKDQEED